MDTDLKFMRPLLRLARWCTKSQSVRRACRRPSHSISTRNPTRYAISKDTNIGEGDKSIVLEANQLTRLTIGNLDLSIELAESPVDETSKIIISVDEVQSSEITEYQNVVQPKKLEEVNEIEQLETQIKELDHPKRMQLLEKLELSNSMEKSKPENCLEEAGSSEVLDESHRIEQPLDKQLLDNKNRTESPDLLMFKGKKFQVIKVCLPQASVENSKGTNNVYDDVSSYSKSFNSDEIYKPTDDITSQIRTSNVCADDSLKEEQQISGLIKCTSLVKGTPCFGKVATHSEIKGRCLYMEKANVCTDVQEETPCIGVAAPLTQTQQKSPCLGLVKAQTKKLTTLMTINDLMVRTKKKNLTRGLSKTLTKKKSSSAALAEPLPQTQEKDSCLGKAEIQVQPEEDPSPSLTMLKFGHDYIRKQLFQSYKTYSPAKLADPETECIKRSNNGGNSILLKQMFQNLETKPVQSEKVSIVGLGPVGISTAAFILQKGLTNNLALMDLRRNWIQWEALDFLHGSSFLHNPTITADSDVGNTKNSKYVIVTGGLEPASNSRKDLDQRTTDVLKRIIPGLVEQSPDATFIIASNSSDLMAWVVHKVGNVPAHRCVSLGCHLDTARFKYYIAKRLNVATTCVDGYIIGEHGESSIPVWSSVSVGGIPLHKIFPNIGTKNDPENWAEVHRQVIESAEAVNVRKGYTNWCVALSITDILEKMKENSGRIVSVGTNVKGTNYIWDSVYLSLPSTLSPNGVTRICKLPLTDWEIERLVASAKVLVRKQCALKL